jgi:tRNA (uracil-5-)-methyltransferase TRM9
MKEDTANRLLDLNRQFYQTLASQFSATRQRLQPGVRQALANLPHQADLLDLGCGNGELWRSLAGAGHQGRYVGLDFSSELLRVATQDGNASLAHMSDPRAAQAVFLQADLSALDWDAMIPSPPFDVVLAFAVLHHLPGEDLRLRVLTKVRELLSPEGCFIHSEWQFLNSPRLRARIQPWEAIGLLVDQVDPGDYLLDWKHGGYGLRYVHHFSLAELEHLAQISRFDITELFVSDGEGGNLGIYQVWRPRA